MKTCGIAFMVRKKSSMNTIRAVNKKEVLLDVYGSMLQGKGTPLLHITTLKSVLHTSGNGRGRKMELCEITKKQCYTTKKDAQTVVNGARAKHWNKQAKNIPKRIYKCPFCSYWHLTKEHPDNDRQEKRTERERRLTNERRRIARMETVIRECSREYR